MLGVWFQDCLSALESWAEIMDAKNRKIVLVFSGAKDFPGSERGLNWSLLSMKGNRMSAPVGL